MPKQIQLKIRGATCWNSEIRPGVSFQEFFSQCVIPGGVNLPEQGVNQEWNGGSKVTGIVNLDAFEQSIALEKDQTAQCSSVSGKKQILCKCRFIGNKCYKGIL